MLIWYSKYSAAQGRDPRLNRSTEVQIGDDIGVKGAEPVVTLNVKERTAEGTQVAEINHAMTRDDLLVLYNTIGRRTRELMRDDHEFAEDTSGNLLARLRESRGDQRWKGFR